MKQQALCLIAILSAASPLYAQEEKEWTLEDCINYVNHRINFLIF